MRSSFLRRRIQGLSIFEGCAIVILMGFVLFAGSRLYANLSPRLEIITARHQLLADLDEVHKEAVAGKKDITVSFTPLKQSYAIDGRSRSLGVPFGIVMDDEVTTEVKDDFVFKFHGDGTATGGSISLYKNDYQENIHIDDKTGTAGTANP